MKAWSLHGDGSYTRVKPVEGEKPFRSQMEFIVLTEEPSPKTQRKRATRVRRFPLVELAANPWK